MEWKYLDTGKRTAAENMALDEAMLSELENEKRPILHLYDWVSEAVTHGHFIDPEKFLNMSGIEKRGLDLAKRPTGGGIVFHNCDLAFSVLLPAHHPAFSLNPLENYAFVNKAVAWAIHEMIPHSTELLAAEPKTIQEECRSFCMAKPTKYDVMVQGKKVGGAAQRKTRHGYLHQGSISLGHLSNDFLCEVLASETVVEGIKQNSFALLGDKWTNRELQEARHHLRSLLQKAFLQVE